MQPGELVSWPGGAAWASIPAGQPLLPILLIGAAGRPLWMGSPRLVSHHLEMPQLGAGHWGLPFQQQEACVGPSGQVLAGAVGRRLTNSLSLGSGVVAACLAPSLCRILPLKWPGPRWPLSAVDKAELSPRAGQEATWLVGPRVPGSSCRNSAAPFLPPLLSAVAGSSAAEGRKCPGARDCGVKGGA